MKRYLPFVIIIAVLLIALVVGRALYRSANTGAPTIPTATVNTSSSIGNTASAVRSPAVVLPGAQPPHVQGGQSARVTLEEFGDFQCPPCRVLHGELKKVEAEYGDRLRVI